MFFFQAEDGIRDIGVTGVQTCALPIYPELDPIEILQEDSVTVMLQEAERRLEPDQLLSYLYTQLESVVRVPRRMSQVLNRLETGTLKLGVAPTDLDDLEHVMRSVANRLGAAL